MRKILLTIMASLLSCSAAQAFWPEATDSSLEVGFGYRRDELKWKTRTGLDSSDSGYSAASPFGAQSTLKWKNLNIWQIEARGEYVTCDNVYLRASGDYGWIVSGKNRDSDYINAGEESQLEISRTHAKTRGHVYDVDVALGYQFKLCDDSFSVTPVVGYSWKGQHLKDRHLRFATSPIGESSSSSGLLRASSDYYDYSSSSSSSSSSSNFHNRYNTRWNGPFVGVDFDYRISCDLELFLDYEFHFAKYHAKADWKLRNDLPNGFHHRSKSSQGHVLDFGVKWDLDECWTLALKGGIQYFHARRGHDRSLVTKTEVGNVDTKCFVSIPLRDVKWCSGSVTFDVGMAF